MADKIIPVILCGGSGTRLWPESRENHPKQFLRLVDDLSLLQNTAHRVQRIVNKKLTGLVTVTSSSLADKVALHLSAVNPDFRQHILREPSARNTAAAIAYAAIYVRQVFGPESLMWILPSDHHIGNESALAEAVSKAAAIAKDGYLATFGIRPYRPEVGYGYIRIGKKIQGEAHLVESFVEKPDEKTAQGFIGTGEYLWNSGMFLFSTEKILDEYAIHSPDILEKVGEAIGGLGSAIEIAAHIYSKIPEQAFDKAIMEKSRNVAVISCDPEWSDIGSWQSLWELREKDDKGNAVKGQAVCHETSNCLIQAGSRLIACAGLENIVIIDTPDALLIADRRNGNAMRELIRVIKKQGCTEVEERWKMSVDRPYMSDLSVFSASLPAQNS